jgi:hypothetical protein
VSTDRGRPDFGTLLDWLEGRLDPGAANEVAAHMAHADERTRRTVDWLRGFLATARQLPLHEPPPIVRQGLNQYFARWSKARAELDRKPREVRVRLLFDSRQDLVPAGVRAVASDDDVFHLAYTAPDGDLLIDVYRGEPGRVWLDGQVLLAQPDDAPVFEASVVGRGFSLRTKDGDELGRFSLHGVPVGRCQLRASNGLITIVADLDLDSGGDQR